MYLCLDQASKHTAYTVSRKNGELARYGIIAHEEKDGEQRLFLMVQDIKKIIKKEKPTLVVFEDIQLQQKSVTVYKCLARLQGMIIYILKEMDVNYVCVPPATWKSHVDIAKGKRDEQKKLSIIKAEETYGISVDGNDDLADVLNINTYTRDIILKGNKK